MIPRRVLALTTLAMALLSVACSSSSALTLEEYAEWCSRDAAESLGFDTDELEGATWGEVTEVFSRLADEAQSVEPPMQLERYHSGRIQLIQALVAFGQTQDEDELFNVFSLIGIGLVASGIVESAEASLSEEARDVLEEAGCLDSDDGDIGEQPSSDQIDRTELAAIGDRISVHRAQDDDRFDMVVNGRPTRSGDEWRLDVTVFAVTDEWTYETSIWTNGQIELVSAPDSMGRIYKLTETDFWWEEPDDTLSGVILLSGGQHRGALYFSGDAPSGVSWIELRYPAGDATKIVDLTR